MELPLAQSAPQGRAASRPPRVSSIAHARWSPQAPLPRVRFAVVGSHEAVVRGEAQPAPERSPASRNQEHRAMARQDAEVEQLRRGISCATLLERERPAWLLDRKGSTRRALKYRRGENEIIIVNHDGQGWWDPQSSAKGDVFDLVQFLDRSLHFGQVREVLRPLIGIMPTFPEGLRGKKRTTSIEPVADRWNAQPRLRRGTQAWRYLTEWRRLPAKTLELAAELDAVREGYCGSAWFAHRDAEGCVSHVESRGPEFQAALSGGAKTLFRFASSTVAATRLAIVEAPIDAMSLAALEGTRGDTLYVATGGGMGPGTEQAINLALAAIASSPEACLVSATDANVAGDRYSVRHAEMAAGHGIAFERLRPPDGMDWNDVLQQGRGA